MAVAGGHLLTPHEILDKLNEFAEFMKAYTTTTVSGLELVREDLQTEMAIMAPVDTPIRNRTRRIQGKKTVALLGCMREALRCVTATG